VYRLRPVQRPLYMIDVVPIGRFSLWLHDCLVFSCKDSDGVIFSFVPQYVRDNKTDFAAFSISPSFFTMHFAHEDRLRLFLIPNKALLRQLPSRAMRE
jgi:hypothetical protein